MTLGQLFAVLYRALLPVIPLPLPSAHLFQLPFHIVSYCLIPFVDYLGGGRYLTIPEYRWVIVTLLLAVLTDASTDCCWTAFTVNYTYRCLLDVRKHCTLFIRAPFTTCLLQKHLG